MDWEVYDLRHMNEASTNAEWLQQHSGEQAPYAQCWPTMLPQSEKEIVLDLPAGDGQNGSQSDYC